MAGDLDVERGAPAVATGWGPWLGARMEALGFVGNSELARAAGVPDSAISRWRTAGTVPSIGQLRRLVDPLQTTMLELLVAAGHLTAEEADLRDVVAPVREPRGLLDAVALDPELPADLKQLLVLQYEAMVSVARARRAEAAGEHEGA